MKMWEVWSEGYIATGEHGPAKLHGMAHADTFAQAVDMLARADRAFAASLNKERTALWGCRLFDNEDDARRSFG